MTRRRASEGGFSLFELLVVVGILIVMAGFASPYMFRVIRNYQMETSGRQIANLVLQARYEAMRRNRRVCAVFQLVGNERRYFLDVNGADNDPCNDAAPNHDAGEPYIVTHRNAAWRQNDTPALPPSFTGLPAGYNTTTTTQAPVRYRITFSPRGIVVQDAGGGNWQPATRVQMITLQRRMAGGSPEFDAVLVTVTPMGRIKMYRWRVGTGADVGDFTAGSWAEL